MTVTNSYRCLTKKDFLSKKLKARLARHGIGYEIVHDEICRRYVVKLTNVQIFGGTFSCAIGEDVVEADRLAINRLVWRMSYMALEDIRCKTPEDNPNEYKEFAEHFKNTLCLVDDE